MTQHKEEIMNEPEAMSMPDAGCWSEIEARLYSPRDVVADMVPPRRKGGE